MSALFEKLLYFIVFILIAASGFIIYKFFSSPQIEEVPFSENLSCVTEQKVYKNEDPLMYELARQDAKLLALYGYYNCNKSRVGDFVLHRYSKSHEPVMRIVRATEGDKFEILQEGQRWNIKVNDEFLKWRGQNYYFGVPPAEPNLLRYQKQNNGVLQTGHHIIFSATAPGSVDSGTFGVVDMSDAVAKIEIVEDHIKTDDHLDSHAEEHGVSGH